jgi:hypothetical protein
MSISRRTLWSLAALAAASAAILYAAPAQYLGRQQDDLLYIIGSQSLAHGSYRLFTCVGQPPMVAVVPGFSILLLPVTWLCGDSYGAYQAFCALVLAGLPWLLWWWLRQRLGELESVLVALLFATSPLVLCQSGTVMSEGSYTALAVLFLAAVETRRAPAAGALLLALTQLRLAGLSLLPAALSRLGRGKDRRAACWTLAPAALAALLWYAWSRCASRGAGEFHALELLVSYQGRHRIHFLAVALDNGRYYLTGWGASFLPPAWSGGGWLAGAALAALALRGARRVWPDQRARSAVLMLAGAGGRAKALLGLLLALQLSFHTRLWVVGVEHWRRPELSRTYAWLTSHSGAADAITSALNVRDGFLCARPSLALPDAQDPDGFAAALRRYRVSRVLWQDGLDVGLSLQSTAAVARKLERIRGFLADGRRFRLVHDEPEERARIYELR